MFSMFRYASFYNLEPGVTEGDQVDGIDVVLDVADEFVAKLCELRAGPFPFKVKNLPMTSLTYFFCVTYKNLYTNT